MDAGTWASTTCQSTLIPLEQSVAGEHSEPPLAPTNEGMLPVTIPGVTSRRSRRSPWVSDTNPTIAPSRTAMSRSFASSWGARQGTTVMSASRVHIHIASSPSPSSSCTTAAHLNLSHQGARLKRKDFKIYVILGSRVSSIADRRGTDRLQPLRTWSNIACQCLFSPIGNERQPTDGPIPTSPMPTSCIASRTPGSLVATLSPPRLNMAATVVDSEPIECGPNCQ